MGFVYECLGLLGWDSSVVVCAFQLGVGGLGLLRRRLSLWVWGWSVWGGWRGVCMRVWGCACQLGVGGLVLISRGLSLWVWGGWRGVCRRVWGWWVGVGQWGVCMNVWGCGVGIAQWLFVPFSLGLVGWG